MASNNDKTAYDALLRDARAMTDDLDLTLEEDYSLEEILAEYGGGREQKTLADVERQVSGEAEAKAPPVPPETVPEAPAQPERPAREDAFRGENPSAEPTIPLPDLGAAHRSAPPREAVRDRAPEGARPAPESPPEHRPAGKDSGKVRPFRAPEKREPPPEGSPESPFPPPPKPVSMEEVVQRTVAAVMEEEGEPELLPERRHRRGLFSRKPLEDTESLYPPEPEPEPEEDEAEPIGPEPDLEELADRHLNAYQRRRAPLWPALLLSLLLVGLHAVEDQGISIPFWSTEPYLRAGVELGVELAVMLLCRSVIAKGFRQLWRRRFSGELMLSLSAFVSFADGASALLLPQRSSAAPYPAVACVGLCVALWGCARESRGWYDTFRTAARTDDPPYLVTETPEGACKQRGSLPGFYTAAARDDLPTLWCAAILPVVFVGTVVFAGLSSVGQGRPQDFLLCWSAILAAASSLALPLCFSLPFSALARPLQRGGCAVAGWFGAERISSRRSVILTDMDLFPPGTVRLNGIKVYGTTLQDAASYAAALARASGSGLGRLFDGLARSEGGAELTAEDFSFYEEGGWSAVVRGESVLLGSASFLRRMDVRLPASLNLKTGLFLSVDRELAAVFAVKYHPAENVDWALRLLRRGRVTPILASRDMNITPALLQRKFNRKVKVEYPSLADRVALSEQEEAKGLPRALLLREGLLPYAETVTGSRRLCSAARKATVLGLFSSAAGALLAYYLCMGASFSLMSPVTLLVFLLLWLLAALLLTARVGKP